MGLKETNRSNKWHHLDFDDSYIAKRYEKSVMVRMPSRTEYDGYIFFHPIKLLPQYMTWTYSLNFPDTWTFRLSANGGEITKELTAAEFIDAVGKEFSRKERCDSYHRPERLDVIENPTAIEELMDND